jgi:hypothetical protein
LGDTTHVAGTETLYCANHPSTETLLRCNKCDKPICQRCGVRTPVGIRCRECAQLRRLPSYTLKPWHYLLAVVVALPASFLAGQIMQYVGIFLAFFLGAAVGGLIAEMVYRATGGKRGRPLAALVSVCILLGALASALGPALLSPTALAVLLPDAWVLLQLLIRVNVVYIFLAIGAALARLS